MPAVRCFWLGSSLLVLYVVACDRSQPVGPAVQAASTGTAGPTVKAPSNTDADATSYNRIDISWQDDSPNETGFEVHRSTSGPGGTFTLRVPTGANVTNYSDTGVDPLTQYCYTVRAFRRADSRTNYSAFSNTACATTPAPPAPAAPSGADAKPANSTAVDLRWIDNSTNEDGFRVERSPDPGSTWATAGTVGPNVTSFRDAGLSSEQRVCYRAIAFNRGGDSPPSNSDCTTPPATPTNVTASAVDQQTIDLTWTDNSAIEDGYEVRRTDGVVAYGTVAHLPANSTSYRDVGVTSDVTHGSIALAKKDGGFSDYWYRMASAVAATVPPLAPSGTDVTPVSNTVIAVMWTDNSLNEDGFRVERSADGGVTWTTVTSMSPYGYGLVDGARPSEQEACYRVIAFNGVGDSPPSNRDCTTPPAGPTNLTATAGAQGIDLTWTDNSAVEDGYEVWVATTCTEWLSPIASQPANSTSYTDMGTFPCWILAYYVVATKDGGYSDYST